MSSSIGHAVAYMISPIFKHLASQILSFNASIASGL